MLQDSLIESRGPSKTRKPTTVLISTMLHVIIVGVLLLIPVVQPQALPGLMIAAGLAAPVMPQQQEESTVVRAPADAGPPANPYDSEFIVPSAIPAEIPTIIDAPRGQTYVAPPSSLRGSSVLELLKSAAASAAAEAAPPPAPPMPEPAPVRQIQRIGGSVQQANLIHQVTPRYPPLARQARVQGVVVLEAVISKEGFVDEMKVVAGHPLLTQAAVDAVKEWRYRPTLLNGEPVAVITTITVSFNLN
jgi:periplasmic protein TonB